MEFCIQRWTCYKRKVISNMPRWLVFCDSIWLKGIEVMGSYNKFWQYCRLGKTDFIRKGLPRLDVVYSYWCGRQKRSDKVRMNLWSHRYSKLATQKFEGFQPWKFWCWISLGIGWFDQIFFFFIFKLSLPCNQSYYYVLIFD